MKLLRENKGKMREEKLIEETEKVFHFLRKTNGCRYLKSCSLEKVIKGALYAGKVF